MRLRKVSRMRRTSWLSVWVPFTWLALQSGALAQSSAALVISSPTVGTIVTAGQAVAVTVTINSGTYPNGIAVFGQQPLGVNSVATVTASTVTIAMPVPATTPPGSYAITAVGLNPAGVEVASAPLNVTVERADLPAALIVDPSLLTFGFVGETQPFTLIGTFANGLQVDISNSTLLSFAFSNPNVATIQNGIITAVGSGQTTITIQYGAAAATIAVTVPASIRGDLNGDGRVDKSDLNIILAALNRPANGPTDARDLNHDGVINALDARILVTLCTNAGCAAN